MKVFKSFGIGLVILLGQVGWADNGPVPTATPAPQFEVNPTTLRQRLLESNLSIIQEYNQLNISKHKVEFSRNSLMPGVTLNATTFTSFGISEIQYLLPFLIPSNWFNYSSAKHQLDAEKISYYIVELNTYSSALGVYFTTLADKQAEPFYEQLAQDYQGIANYYKALAKKGIGGGNDYVKAQGLADINLYNASQVRNAVGAEQEVLKNMLSIDDPNTKIVLDPFSLPESEWETKDLQTADDQAIKVSPEEAQLIALLAAKGADIKSTKFSFITGSQLSSSSSSPGGLSTLTGGVGITLSPNLIPNVKLSEDNKIVVQTTQKDTTNGLKQTVATALINLNEAKYQQKVAGDGEAKANQAYSTDKILYKKGLLSFVDLKNDGDTLTVSTIQRIRADQNLNLARVTMERTFLIDQFAAIKGCNPADGSKKKHASLQEVCRPAGSGN